METLPNGGSHAQVEVHGLSDRGGTQEADAGVAVARIARKSGISAATYYQWRAKFGGMGVSYMKRVREIEQENGRLKRMYADLSLDHSLLKQLIRATML